jgi:hypothetical protein
MTPPVETHTPEDYEEEREAIHKEDLEPDENGMTTAVILWQRGKR